MFGKNVNKWQIICPLVAMALAALVFAMVSDRNHYRYYVHAHTRMVGEELVATTNSPRLAHIGSGLRERLSEFLVSRGGVAEVSLGDVPPPIGDGTACSWMILSNAIGGRLGIRLCQDSEPKKFHVLGFWTVSEPVSPTSGSQPTTTDSLPERRSVALSNNDSPTVSVVCELRYYLVGHVSSITRTNRLRIMRNDGTNFTCAIAEPLRLLQTVDTNLLWEVGGFIFQIVEPKDFAGQVLTAHFDGPLASGDPFKAFAPGKRYRMNVSQKFVGKTDFGVCY